MISVYDSGEQAMLLLQPLFVCLVGVGVAVLVIATAPVWSAAVAGLSEWIFHTFRQASHVADGTSDEDDNIVEGWVVNQPASDQEDGSLDKQEKDRESQ